MKTLFKIAIFSAALLITACNKTPVSNEPDNTAVPEIDPREDFVGDYNLSINGDVNTVVSIPMLTINREGTYPVSYSDAQMRIEKMPTHPDSVVVTITIENETEETHGEVIGNKLLMQPMKMRMKISDILDGLDLGLSETMMETIKPFIQNAELELKLYHSPATLNDSTLTLTTDVEAEIANSYFSFSLDGTLNDKATKK
ncbi:MAG: hypothetical protein SPK97_02945 [Bacteroidales bacterium]|nr:hypothetical protein [Bacteroidales bacterium]